MYSIKKRNDYVAILMRQKEQVFHTQDIAVLWNISNKNNLYTTIKRYCKKGVLHRIYKGMYSTVPINEIHPWKLGAKALHDYCYVSAETILQKEGFINAVIRDITFVSNKSKTFRIGSNFYKSRKLQEKFLFNPAGIVEENSAKKATETRAIADMLYFNPRANFDKPVDWEKVEKIQKAVGYPLTKYRYVHS
ncbi:type IV toxin-antitoxin system AbiEi family antitoxin domain-containing protein [Candidatus Peregrinibacteria bacterium]|nr:type IV toxin-antitoxin system AbiEi family antitoxin domain-containing protein [Candidatus Peregrinibacteria bacterium]